MKKVLTLALCVLMLISALASCAHISQDAEEKGAIIPIYLSSPVNTLDPMYAYLDDAGSKMLGLLYEGLFTVNAKGEVVKALCESYKSGTDRDGDFYMEFTLKNTHWSDGRSVTSDDFVYAWKRIIEPSSNSEAAAMLFDIKNARACKMGDESIDSFGAVSTEPQILTVTFEREIDESIFLRYLASPALVPLREDKAERLPDWASFYATTVTNGPFYPKIFVPGEPTVTLERSIYYYRDMDSEIQKLDKYVSPYRFVVYCCTPEEALEKYKAGEIVFMTDLPLDARAEYKDTAKVQDTFSTATLYLNTAKAPFDNANVRRALSLALDRNELVNIVTFAKAAGGIIPESVFNTNKGTSFRKEGGSLLAAEADMAEAKKLISAAGISGTEITIKIRDDETSHAVADYVTKAWGELGITVNVDVQKYIYNLYLDYDQYTDQFSKAYYAKDFDVMLVDALATSVDPFSTLAPFAVEYSGAAINLAEGDYDAKPGVTGYSNPEFDAKIDEAYNTDDKAKRASALHDAEGILMNDLPVIPLFVYQNAYLNQKVFSDFDLNYYAEFNFKEAELDDYKEYEEYKKVYVYTEEELESMEAAENAGAKEPDASAE